MIDPVIAFITQPQLTATLKEDSYIIQADWSKVHVYAEEYSGDYEITPTTEPQILQTEEKHMKQNVVINPIPNNYGLITYNGYGITVS